MRASWCLVAGLFLLGACKDKSSPSAAPQGSAQSPAAVVDPVGPPGSCKLTLDGAQQASQPDGRAEGRLSAWFTKIDKPDDLAPDSFIIECKGEALYLKVRSMGISKMQPRRYLLDEQHSDLELTLELRGERIPVTGAVDVTQYDQTAFVAAVKLDGAYGKGAVPVTLQGTINYACPGFTGCKR